MKNASAKELFVLGRVSLRPTHGHEIMRTLKESEADLWVELSEKHVYYILRKLAKEGLVDSVEERPGTLPARNVYAVTPAGRAALAAMMTADNLVNATPYSEFDVLLGMLCYTDALDDTAKDEVLARRETLLNGRLERLRREPAALAGEVATFPTLMLAKVARDLTAELEWLRSVRAQAAASGWASLRPTLPGSRTEA